MSWPSRRWTPPASLAMRGSRLTGFSSRPSSGSLQHLADLVDQEAIGFAAQVDADRHRRLAVVVLGQAEPGAHVDHGDDAAAQIEHAGDLARRQRHPRQPFRHEHVLHPRDRQAEQLAADHGGDVFGDGAFGRCRSCWSCYCFMPVSFMPQPG